MSVQGHSLEITVVECRKLKDTEWISRQDPYVVLEYGSNQLRTKTDTDGGRNPSFNEQFMLSLVEGLREINVTVWNHNLIRNDYFIGSGKILLQKALTDGHHDHSWPLTTRNGRRAGEIRVILHYTNHAQNTRPRAEHAAPSGYPRAEHAQNTRPSGYGEYPPGHVPYSSQGQPPYGYRPQGYPPYPPQGYPPYLPGHVPDAPQGYPPYPPQGQDAAPYPPY